MPGARGCGKPRRQAAMTGFRRFYDVESRAQQPSCPSPRGDESDQSFVKLVTGKQSEGMGNNSPNG